MAFYGFPEQPPECHLMLNFDIIDLHPASWNSQSFRGVVEYTENTIKELSPGAWPTWALGNHDISRVASRLGEEKSKLATLLLLTLRGTPIIYNGDELGMLNTTIEANKLGDIREPFRGPMQWDNTPNSGFTASHCSPWLPLSKDWNSRNVYAQRGVVDSPLEVTAALVKYRSSSIALQCGSYSTLEKGNQHTKRQTSIFYICSLFRECICFF